MSGGGSVTVFLRGRLRVLQPERGYRFNVDSVILSLFARVRDGERVLDLGSGSGILLLLAGYFHHPARLLGVELQPDLAAMAAENLTANGWDAEAECRAGDLRDPDLVEAGAWDLAVSNPPYHDPARGMPSPDPARDLARRGGACSLPELCAAAARALAPRGRFCFLAPTLRLAEALDALGAAGLSPRLTRAVHAAPGSDSHVTLVQARREPGVGCLALPPLHLRDEAGDYAPEVQARLDADRGPAPRFLLDAMLGRLARYLRLLGYDAAYVRGAGDAWLLREAARSERTLLTRDRTLAARCARDGVPAFAPDDDAPERQLALVGERFGPPPKGAAPRCLACGAVPLEVDAAAARPFVPRYTALTHPRFRACPCCGTLTWEGSHLARFRERVAGPGA